MGLSKNIDLKKACIKKFTIHQNLNILKKSMQGIDLFNYKNFQIFICKCKVIRKK